MIAYVGAAGESWTNRYVEISLPLGQIYYLNFYGVSSADAIAHYCLDDLTINFVPEPSSLLALSAFLAPLAGLAIRRRR